MVEKDGVHLQNHQSLEQNVRRANEEKSSTETVEGALLVIIHELYRAQKRYY